MYPRYSYPARLIFGLVRDALLRRRRSFRSDARLCIARLRPPLRVLGAEHTPSDGCHAITLNHYYRPGYASQWSALAISASLPADVHWTMTDELTFFGSWLAPLGMPVSRFVLGRLAAVYAFSPMPPMPPRLRDLERRAHAVRAVLRYVTRTPAAFIALAPEGADQPGGRLSMPPPGAGRFCLLLASAGLRFLPVGVYESGGALTLNFGEPYELHIAHTNAAHEKDRLAASAVMRHIAALLPIDLRGEFAQESASSS